MNSRTITCPQCRTVNPASAETCNDCNLQLGSRCPDCAGRTLFSDRFCPHCGTRRHIFCSSCGKPLLKTDRFCIHCGETNTACTLPDAAAPEEPETDTAPADAAQTAMETGAEIPDEYTRGTALPERKTQDLTSRGSISPDLILPGTERKKAVDQNPLPELEPQNRKTAKPKEKPQAEHFHGLKFRWPFRQSQQMILDLIARKLQTGERQYHIVAPPGSGKTIVGLELIRRLGAKALVLTPNTTIQAQWADKLKFFKPEDREQEALKLTATRTPDEGTPFSPITILTYQALSLPSRESDFLKEYALRRWTATLTDEREMTGEEAAARIAAIEKNNPEAWKKELARYKKSVKKQLLEEQAGEIILRLLHPSIPKLLAQMAEEGVRTLVLDECHHLLNYWAIVLKKAIALLGDITVIGLTATPPLEAGDKEQRLYSSIVGEVDFQIPLPAVVKEGNLAPYSDLVLLTLPLEEEHRFIKQQSENFNTVFNRLQDRETTEHTLQEWVVRKLDDMPEKKLRNFFKNSRPLAEACYTLLQTNNAPELSRLPYCNTGNKPLTLEQKALLLEDYTLNYLKLSPEGQNSDLLDAIRSSMKNLGYLLTESGLRRYISPVDRVLGLSGSKVRALKTILSAESGSMGERLRAAVVCDYEKTSATALKQLSGVLDSEAGGAVKVLRFLTADPELDRLDPILLTGTTILCDDDLTETFLKESRKWIEENNKTIQLTTEPDSAGFTLIKGTGKDFSPKSYVLMITDLFDRGITRCLVGTRGLLGEGWDSVSLNTLIDLTAVTSFVSINQLRGRSLRINRNHPEKHSNNWDVVCIAPEYSNGLNDYSRFMRKHNNLYGLCDDGQIENGIGHISPLFNDLEATDIRRSMDRVNSEMLDRLTRREEYRKLWKVKEPYSGRELLTLELNCPQPEDSKVIQPEAYLSAISKAVFYTMRERKLLTEKTSSWDITITKREEGTFRIFLKSDEREACENFATALFEMFQPLFGARYVIPRLIKERSLMQMLIKNILGIKYNENIVYHPVPSLFANNKKNVKLFTTNWQRYVTDDVEPLYIKHSDSTMELETRDERLKQQYRPVLKKVWV